MALHLGQRVENERIAWHLRRGSERGLPLYGSAKPVLQPLLRPDWVQARPLVLALRARSAGRGSIAGCALLFQTKLARFRICDHYLLLYDRLPLQTPRLKAYPPNSVAVGRSAARCCATYLSLPRNVAHQTHERPRHQSRPVPTALYAAPRARCVEALLALRWPDRSSHVTGGLHGGLGFATRKQLGRL